MTRMKVFGINFFIFGIIILAFVLYFTKEIRDEGFFVSPEAFGMSPGTMDQLSSTRVSDVDDVDDIINDNLIRQGIINMTESGYDNTDYAKI